MDNPPSLPMPSPSPGLAAHMYNKSIHAFRIFRNAHEKLRLKRLMHYYQYARPPMSYANYERLNYVRDKGFESSWKDNVRLRNDRKIIRILAYCIMTTHFHWLVEELTPGALSVFSNNVLNSYSHYFNLRYQRKGPLWQNRTQRTIKSEAAVLDCTAYIHLNPTSDNLVSHPQDWVYSSYHEYAGSASDIERICDIPPFVEAGPSYIRWLIPQIKDYRQEKTDRKK